MCHEEDVQPVRSGLRLEGLHVSCRRCAASEEYAPATLAGRHCQMRGQTLKKYMTHVYLSV